MKQPNICPAYAMLYPVMTEITREHGYSLAIHGSMINDLDLACIPWTEDAVTHQILVKHLVEYLNLFVTNLQTPNPDTTLHGRVRYHLSIDHGRYIDLSIMPLQHN